MKYRLESVLFLCTVHISDVPSGKCSVSVHSTFLTTITRELLLNFKGMWRSGDHDQTAARSRNGRLEMEK
jgi:hypothetical protein